ncbi:protein FAM114A2 [Sitodiplosis mosellana]|uniref:protein FAM114A2 n=1 Tax=Sitodiplosis mosellana TaxID=263140 RepID=UPI00244522DB|nr:protein FAM114A2 [Sitodiplosis mosellana]
MSHSDSEGFESAEDDDFAATKPAAKNTKPATNPKAPCASGQTTKKEVETLDKFKALDVNDEGNDGDNDDWGWGDDDEDEDNFKFESKQPATTVSETPKVDTSVTAKRLVQLGSRQESAQQVSGQEEFSRQEPVRQDSTLRSQLDTPSAWSPWSGMVSLLSTASTGVASFTSHVSSVIESNIGIPDPERFAQQQQQEKNETATQTTGDQANDTQSIDSRQQNEEKLLNLGSFVSNVTSISNRVIAGGLDTLEGIGKKTMTIIQENDAGLISKRKLLGLDNEKPVLSQVLREAKEKSEESEKTMKLTQKKLYRKQLHFETLFDDYHGLVHLEALEMLSKQASLKLQALLMPLSGIALNELQQTMNSVNELCELNELDQDDTPTHLYDVTELEDKLKTATEDFDIPIDFTDILDTWKENRDWLDTKTDEHQPQQIHDNALKCLAKTSALAINKYHKLAELLLIKDHHSTVNESDCLLQLTNTFCWHLSGIATLYSDKLTNITPSDPEIQSNSLITNIFLEGSKSTSYIQNGFQLFIPILQVGAV